jgi:hypothetical protein
MFIFGVSFAPNTVLGVKHTNLNKTKSLSSSNFHLILVRVDTVSHSQFRGEA